MKICYLGNAQSIHTLRWVKHFSSMGNEVTLISFEDASIADVNVIVLNQLCRNPKLNVIANIPRVRRLVRDNAPDILHAHYATSYGFAGACAGFRPYVVSAWGSDVLVSPRSSRVYEEIVRFVFRRATRINSVAQHMTDSIVKWSYARSEKIVTIPFGVDTTQFLAEGRAVHSTRSNPVIVSTRRLNSQLQVDLLLRAAPLVLTNYPGAKFVVIGDGPERPALTKVAQELGVASSVSFVGELPPEGIATYLRSADIFVTTSPTDGSSVSLNEAMACGAFPVATAIEANQAWLRGDSTGFFFEPGDAIGLAAAIVRALNAPEIRERAVAENRLRVERDGAWLTATAAMEALYKSLLTPEH